MLHPQNDDRIQSTDSVASLTLCISFSSLARVIAVSRGSWNLMASAGNTLVLE